MLTDRIIKISDYDYELPEERIAKFPLDRRDSSKLLVYRDGSIDSRVFNELGDILPDGAMLVFNNTRVIRARLIMHKPSGARIEVFCLEPCLPADYERAFAVKDSCSWWCIVGNLKKWKEGFLEIPFEYEGKHTALRARRGECRDKEHAVHFEWDADMTFGELLEYLGKIPIPPYLNRDSEDIDNSRYQTVYSRFEGSVAAPTAGFHFTDELISRLKNKGFNFGEVTLHVGAGTFLPVKDENAVCHTMHTEHFEVTGDFLRELLDARSQGRKIIPVGTTSVRTLESLAVLGYRVKVNSAPEPEKPISQWEAYGIPAETEGKELIKSLLEYMSHNSLSRIQTSTQIMIAPVGFVYRVVDGMITNFHQPKSTLLLLVSALVGENWKNIYEYALANGYRFLSYGDSSLLMRE